MWKMAKIDIFCKAAVVRVFFIFQDFVVLFQRYIFLVFKMGFGSKKYQKLADLSIDL